MKTFKQITKYLIVVVLLVILVGCHKKPANPTKPTENPSETKPIVIPSEVTSFLNDELITYVEGDHYKNVTSNIILTTSIKNYDIVWASNSDAITINDGIGAVTRGKEREDVVLNATLTKDGVDVKARTFTLRVISIEHVFVLINLDGGQIDATTTYEIPVGSTISDIGIPIKKGYVFVRWDFNGVEFDFKDTIEQGGVITAIYEKAYKVTLILEDSTLPEGTPIIWYIAIGDTLEVLSDLKPTKEGYIFVGWFYLGSLLPLDTVIEEDILITVKFLYDSSDNNNYGNYYNEITATEGLTLINQLKTLISGNLGTYGNGNIGYDTVRNVLVLSDKNINNSNYLWGMYDGKNLKNVWDNGATWNREHVWPNSRLATNESVGTYEKSQASDPHNLRAIDKTTNEKRNNYYFVSHAPSEVGLVLPGSKYYPGDPHRGDVARILLYMAVRYRGILTLVETPTGPTYTPTNGTFGDITILLNWHLDDPVDEFEIKRNKVIYDFQGNRNPFIDKPELFEPVWSQLLIEEQARQASQQRFETTQQQLKTNTILYIKTGNKFRNIFN